MTIFYDSLCFKNSKGVTLVFCSFEYQDKMGLFGTTKTGNFKFSVIYGLFLGPGGEWGSVSVDLYVSAPGACVDMMLAIDLSECVEKKGRLNR